MQASPLLVYGFSFLMLLTGLPSCKETPSANESATPLVLFKNLPSVESDSLLKFTQGLRAILHDKQGNIWFGSHQEGVAKWDGNTFSYYTMEQGLSDNQVRSIYEDEAGNIWFECARGISKYDGEQIRPEVMRNYLSLGTWPTNPQGLWFKGDEVHGYNDRERDPGVYRLQDGNLTYYNLPTKGFRADQAYYSVSTSFVQGQDNRVWFGTYGSVFGYDGSEFKVIDSDYLNLNDSTGFLHVRSLFEDSAGGLWIGNNGLGVFHYDGDTVRYFSEAQGLTTKGRYATGGNRSGPGTLEHVFSIGEDAEGHIWFGDRDTGAWKYDGATMTNYGIKDGLSTTHIWQIYLTPENELWFAMGDGAVCRFNGSGFDRIF